jgi:hypothetical protein
MMNGKVRHTISGGNFFNEDKALLVGAGGKAAREGRSKNWKKNKNQNNVNTSHMDARICRSCFRRAIYEKLFD